MKKLLKLMLAAVLISTAAISCTKDKPEPPAPGPDTKPYPYPTVAEALTGEGVTLKVSNITNNNFTVTTVVGEDLPAYRFDVIPLAKYYNDWLEANKQGEMTEEEWIYKRLFDNGGISGFTFGKPIDVTWGGSIYNQAAIVPGIDYIILASGALYANGTGYGEITKLKVSLEEKDPIGNPVANIEPIPDYQGITFNFTMNDDCYGYYYLAPKTEEITTFMEFVETRGEDVNTMLRDVTCTFLKAPFLAPETFSQDFGFAAVPGLSMTALTVGLDSDGTLSKTVSSKEAVIQEAPQLPKAEYTVEILNASARAVSTKWWGKWDVTRAIYHRMDNKASLGNLLSTYTEKGLAQLLAYEGWGHNGNNDEHQIYVDDIFPNGEYVITSTARNKAMDLLPIRHDTFKTKPLIKDQALADQSLAKVQVEIMTLDKTSVKLKYIIPEGTMVFFERILEAGSTDYDTGKPLDPVKDPQFCADWVSDIKWGNMTAGDGPTEWSWEGLEPDTDYIVYIVGEDKEGRMGPLFHLPFSTASNAGGPEPKMELTWAMGQDYDGALRWSVYVRGNKDTRFHRTARAEEALTEAIKEAGGAGITVDDKGFGTPKDDLTKEAIINYLMDNNNAAESINNTEKHCIVTRLSDVTVASLPFGQEIEGTVSGERVQGPLAILKFQEWMLSSVQSSVMPMKTAQAAAAVTQQSVGAGKKIIRHAF